MERWEAVREDCRDGLDERPPGGRGASAAGIRRSFTGVFCIHLVACCMSFKTPGLYRESHRGGRRLQPYPLGTGGHATTICRGHKCILVKCHFRVKGWKRGWISPSGRGWAKHPETDNPGVTRASPREPFQTQCLAAAIQYRGRLESASMDHRSMPPARLMALGNPMDRRKPTARALRMPWWQ